MKKHLLIALTAVLIITTAIGLAACRKSSYDDTATADTATATSKTIKAEEKATTTETLPAGEINATTQAVTSSDSSSSSTISSDNSSKSEDNKSNKSNDTQSEKTNSNSSSDTKTSNNSGSNNNSSSEKSNAVQKSDNTNKSDNTSSSSQATWHEAVYKTVHHDAVTERVWVVDKAEYTYEEPIYDEVGVAICNDCGADITNADIGEHCVEHAENGGRGSYHVDVIKKQVGTKTVEEPEQGHYETKIVTQSYDEQVLVKEAGYY